jgi:hypothetical protein
MQQPRVLRRPGGQRRHHAIKHAHAARGDGPAASVHGTGRQHEGRRGVQGGVGVQAPRQHPQLAQGQALQLGGCLS